MIIVGLDAAMRNVGIAIADYCTLDRKIVGIERIQLVSTEADKKAKRKNADDFKRIKIMEAAIKKWTDIADIVIAEMPSGSQSARASLGSGAVLGVLSGIKYPLIQVQPSETKMVVGKNAEKEEIIAWAVEKYPDLPWIRLNNKPTGRILKENEHIADAIAVIHMGVQKKEFLDLLDRFDELDGFSESEE